MTARAGLLCGSGRDREGPPAEAVPQAPEQAVGSAAGARQKAVDLATAAREQTSAGAAAAAPVWDATPEPARRAAAKGAGAARHRVLLAVATGVLIVGFLVIRWWRKQ